MPEVIFTGPAGRIEGRYHPARQKNAPIGIVLHPHPQFGGTMNHQIVYQLYYAFVHRGFSALRFNFRGVGRSQGGVRPRHRRTFGRRRRARLGPDRQSRGARLLDRGLFVRRLDRHAASDAPPRDRRLHLDRAAGQPLRFLVPRALPVLGADHSWRQGRRGAARDVTTLVEKLKTQKGIVIEQKVVPGANHFFDGKIEPLMETVSAYLAIRYAAADLLRPITYCLNRSGYPSAAAQTARD